MEIYFRGVSRRQRSEGTTINLMNALTYLVSFGGGALVHDALLHKGDPVGENGVDEGVDGDGDGRVILRVLEAELVVPGEAGAGDDEGGVAEHQSRVD